MLQVAAYCRVSTDKEDQANSFEAQQRYFREYIQRQPDWELQGIYADEGFSGTSTNKRVEFNKMLHAAELGQIDLIVTKEVSRFARNTVDALKITRELRRRDVGVLFLNDNIDTLKDNADDLVVGVKSIINDAYSRDISVKTRSALNTKRDHGDYVGACPIYGYRRCEESKNRLTIDEYPASIVRDIFRMKIDGMSAMKIAETLNSRGVLSPMEYKRDRDLPHPKGGFADTPDAKWSATAIFRILNDETYTGMLIQGRRGTLNYKIKDVVDRPESEWKRTENAHEPIISPQDFDLARRIMQLDTRTAPGGEKVYLFSGLLICGCCGGRMTRKTNRYKGQEYFYYYCPTGKKNGCDGVGMIREQDLIQCVLESVKGHIAGIASLDSVLAVSDGRKAAIALARQLGQQIEDNERQLAKTIGFKTSLYENMVSGLLTKDDFKTLKTKYAADELRLRDAIAALEEERSNALDGRAERLRWMEHFRKFEGLEELDRRTMVNLMRSIRVLSKTELSVTFHYQVEYAEALTLLQKEVA